MLGLAHDVARLSGLRRWGDVFRYRLRAGALPSLRRGTFEQPSMYMLWKYTWCFFICVHAFDMYEKAYVNEERYTYVCIHRYVWLYMDVYAGICSCEWGTYIFPSYLQHVK